MKNTAKNSSRDIKPLSVLTQPRFTAGVHSVERIVMAIQDVQHQIARRQAKTTTPPDSRRSAVIARTFSLTFERRSGGLNGPAQLQSALEAWPPRWGRGLR